MPTPLSQNPRIGRGMCVSGKQRRLMACTISQGLHALALGCAHQRQPTADGISQGLHASDVACAHKASDVDQC